MAHEFLTKAKQPLSPALRDSHPAAPPRLSAGPATILQLQKSIGNAATGRALAQGGNGLPPALRAGIESLSGLSMGDVNVHYNSPKPRELNAHAFTQGSDIHLASGQEQHLPHEAWHAVQQKRGQVSATTQLKGMQLNDSAALEREADAMGARALTAQGDGPVQRLAASVAAPVVQRVKLEELTEEQRAFIDQNAIKFFTAAKGTFPAGIKVKDKKQYAKDNFPAAIAGLTAEQVSAIIAALQTEIGQQNDYVPPLDQPKANVVKDYDPETIYERNADTGVVSCKNVKVGPDGLFDMVYNEAEAKVTITVKIKNTTPGIKIAYDEVALFWSSASTKFNIEHGQKKLTVDIVVAETGDDDYHFDPAEAGQGTGASVVRRSRSLVSKLDKPDLADNNTQWSLGHEFGHVLGLGEEYGGAEKRTHANDVEDVFGVNEKNAVLTNTKDQQPELSIMSEKSNVQHPRHYIGIVMALKKMAEQTGVQFGKLTVSV